MRFRLIHGQLAVLCLGLLLIGPRPGEGQEVAPPAPPGTDVQARGPVHEAYAEPTTSVGVPGPVVVKEPPAPIEEAPPQEKPAGDNIVWIPGYWGWDSDSSEYLWVSGFWRTVPPGRTWTPGHWQRTAEGWQFVSGFWAKAEAIETEYLPAPPATLDRGPSVPAPVQTSTYVPGIWVYQTSRYLWRPGYWVAYRPGWVWTPSFYRWTPGGYIYVAGFWDVPLLERGLLFAPVRYVRPVYLTLGYVYRPVFVVQPDFLVGALFVRVGRPAFYFGNYFEPAYRRTYVSWMSYRVNRFAIDVNFSYYRATYVKYPDWERNLVTLYRGRFDGSIDRPPVTLVQQNRIINNITINKTTNVVVGRNINITHLQNASVLQPIAKASSIRVTAMASLASNKPVALPNPPVGRDLRVERLSKERLVEERRAVTRYNTIARERRAAESAAIKRPPAVGTAPVRVKATLPRETPAARVIHPTIKPPPPPSRPKVGPASKDKGK
jgi:hypothetical protein